MKKQMKRLILTALLAGVSVGVPARTPGLPAADTVSGAMPAAPVSAPVAAASDTSGGERSEWLPSFTAVEVAAPVDIRFVQVPDTEAPRIIYDTKGSYTTRFRAEVRDRVLRITERRDARRPERTTVTVCYNTLERISVSDAAATFEGRFSATLLDLTVGGAAKLTADLDVKDLRMELSGHSSAALSGAVRYLTLFVSTGAVEAPELETMSAQVNVTSSGSATLWVTDRFEAKTSTGGPFIDSTGIHNLTNLCRISQQENTRIILSGVNPKVHEVLHKAGFYSLLGEENICPNINAALRRAKELVVEPKEK